MAKKWTGSVSQPRDGESPSQHVARLIKEGVAAQNTPTPTAPREPMVAAGADCPDCRGNGACGTCGNRA